MLALAASTAYADEAANKRLTKFGKLSGAQAGRVASTVTGRMKRAADMTGSTDPLRMAVSSALFGSSVPADQMAAAKVRLRLYAGLNEWALDNLFAPKPGAVSACSSSYGLTSKECEALLAAGGRTSLADAARQGAGASAPMVAAGPQPAYGQAQPQYGYAQRPQQPAQASRFGRYDSGFRPTAQPQAAYGQPAARPAAGYGYGQPAARPMAARPMAVAPVAPPPNPALAANRKAEYERKRQEYLDRKKAEMAARKNKIVATAGGTDRVSRGPTSEAEAEAAGMAAPTATVAAPAKGAAAKTAAAPAAAADDAPAEEPQGKPALDNEFLDGLLDDPLGK